MPADRPEPRADVLLLDVGVEGVEQDADSRMADLARQRLRVGGRVEEERLEAVQRLDRERDSVALQRVSERLVTLDGALPLVGGPAPARQVPDRAVERAGD